MQIQNQPRSNQYHFSGFSIHIQAIATSHADAAIECVAFWKQVVHDIEIFPDAILLPVKR